MMSLNRCASRPSRPRSLVQNEQTANSICNRVRRALRLAGDGWQTRNSRSEIGRPQTAKGAKPVRTRQGRRDRRRLALALQFETGDSALQVKRQDDLDGAVLAVHATDQDRPHLVSAAKDAMNLKGEFFGLRIPPELTLELQKLAAQDAGFRLPARRPRKEPAQVRLRLAPGTQQRRLKNFGMRLEDRFACGRAFCQPEDFTQQRDNHESTLKQRESHFRSAARSPRSQVRRLRPPLCPPPSRPFPVESRSPRSRRSSCPL